MQQEKIKLRNFQNKKIRQSLIFSEDIFGYHSADFTYINTSFKLKLCRKAVFKHEEKFGIGKYFKKTLSLYCKELYFGFNPRYGGILSFTIHSDIVSIICILNFTLKILHTECFVCATCNFYFCQDAVTL